MLSGRIVIQELSQYSIYDIFLGENGPLSTPLCRSTVSNRNRTSTKRAILYNYIVCLTFHFQKILKWISPDRSFSIVFKVIHYQPPVLRPFFCTCATSSCFSLDCTSYDTETLASRPGHPSC